MIVVELPPDWAGMLVVVDAGPAVDGGVDVEMSDRTVVDEVVGAGVTVSGVPSPQADITGEPTPATTTQMSPPRSSRRPSWTRNSSEQRSAAAMTTVGVSPAR